MLNAFLWGGLAAGSLLLGYAVAGRGISNRTLGGIMGMGSGALIGAIAYELIPESVLKSVGVAVAAAGGALAFQVGDWLVDMRGGAKRKDLNGTDTPGSGAAILVGTLLDNIPESIVMGMSLALGGAVNVAFLAAVFVSNFPEGVAGTLNLQLAGVSRAKVRSLWTLIVLVSAASSAVGYAAISWMDSATGVYASAFAAGAMLTMLAEAMIPEAYEHGGKLVGLATVSGFLATAALLLNAALAAEPNPSNKWRLQFSGDADTDGEIELVLTPKDGQPESVVVTIPKGTGENSAARLLVGAIRAKFGDARFHSEVDDGEDVLIKANRGTPSFDVTIQRNTTGLRIRPDKE